MKEQKSTTQTQKGRLLRFLLAAVTFLAGLSLLGDLAAWAVHRMGGISFAAANTATIGIIGGADGPTSIFVTTSTAPVLQTLLKIFLLSAGFLLWRHLNRRK